jgi:hypothetical protein
MIFAKLELLKEFDNTEVVQELLSGPSTTTSKFLEPRGNLASFLGMEDSSLEVGRLRNFLDENIGLNNSVPNITNDKNKIYYDFRVKVPSKTELNENFPVPDNFTSKSWLEVIETGLGATASAIYYIFNSKGLPNSRSGYGLQSKYRKKSGGEFKPIKFISKLLEDFAKKFK